VGEKDDKRQLKTYLFPRYHQLDATRKLLVAVLVDGAGQKYLVQHSAGSGKTKTSAWAAHFCADLQLSFGASKPATHRRFKTGHHVGGIGRKNRLVRTCWQGVMIRS
jgi:hypothetical protein